MRTLGANDFSLQFFLLLFSLIKTRLYRTSVGGFADCAYDETDIFNCWTSAKNISASGGTAALGSFIGHNSGQIFRVYVLGAQSLTEENALISKADNSGTVEAS